MRRFFREWETNRLRSKSRVNQETIDGDSSLPSVKTAGSGNDVSRLRFQREEEFQIFVFLLGQVIENEAGEEGRIQRL